MLWFLGFVVSFLTGLEGCRLSNRYLPPRLKDAPGRTAQPQIARAFLGGVDFSWIFRFAETEFLGWELSELLLGPVVATAVVGFAVPDVLKPAFRGLALQH